MRRKAKGTLGRVVMQPRCALRAAPRSVLEDGRGAVCVCLDATADRDREIPDSSFLTLFVFLARAETRAVAVAYSIYTAILHTRVYR